MSSTDQFNPAILYMEDFTIREFPFDLRKFFENLEDGQADLVENIPEAYKDKIKIMIEIAAYGGDPRMPVPPLGFVDYGRIAYHRALLAFDETNRLTYGRDWLTIPFLNPGSIKTENNPKFEIYPYDPAEDTDAVVTWYENNTRVALRISPDEIAEQLATRTEKLKSARKAQLLKELKELDE